MSWIKDNKFVVALGAGTLVGVILIFLAGSKGAARYLQAKEDFDATSAEVTLFEGRALYPRSENCDGKSKALDEYRQATAALQTAFETYRPKELKNVSPEDFANQLKAVNGEVRKTCEDAGTKVPEPFFCGFENYKIGLAPGNATGILNYQLSGIQTLICALAKSGATELHNFHRATLPEEDGREYKPGNFEVARSLPFEITFSGPEKSARAFLSAVIKQKDYYFVIRTISATNSKKEPPRSSDAKFDKPAPPPPAATDGIFSGGGFVLPPTDEQPKVDDKKPAPGTTNPHFPALRSGHRLLQRPSPQKQIPSS
ncbi:MAG: Amuc_1100 family pilus-like protein, partial [Verrucomicrobia bacterium]|nr:Amuc_1100 family pilus-like protein [Verrucomicrobiota bacterium]